MNLHDIYQDLQNELQLIEKELARTVYSSVDQLEASSLHLLTAGGKRMRPIFVLLAGHFGPSYDASKLRKLAVALELIHMATLVHDDVIDDANLRRGRQTVRAEWNNQVAMFTGDYILAQGLQVMSQFKNPKVHQILATAIKEMVLGEIEQICDLYSDKLTLRSYLHRIKRKTAFLIAISCQLAALVSGASAEVVYRCYLYGYYVGMAFQMTDDILDFKGTEDVLGKPAGSDLRQGNVTLPVIYALRHESEENKQKLMNYLLSQGTEGDLEEILEIIRKSGGIDYTVQLSERYLEKALQMLNKLPNTHVKESFQLISDFVVRRSY